MGQSDSLVTSALKAYERLHPEASFQARDSIQMVLLDWRNQRLYFNYWPTADLERIPFLTPKSAFSLGRYISETGPLHFSEEWRATGLSPQEQRWMDAFFQTGYPHRTVLTSSPPWSVGIEKNAMGWSPLGQYRGLQVGRHWRLGGMTLVPRASGGPILRSQRMRHEYVLQAGVGLQWTYHHSSRTQINGTYIQGEPALGFKFTRPRWNWQGMTYRSGWACVWKWKFPDGTYISYTKRSDPFRWPSSWLDWPSADRLALVLPYRRGQLLLEAMHTRSQLSYAARQGILRLVQYPGIACLEGQINILSNVQVDVRLGRHSSEHAWAIHRTFHQGEVYFETSIGTMGGHPPGPFSKMRMSAAGPYVRASMRFHDKRQNGWLRISIRPNDFRVYGAYSLQLDQKWG